MSLPISGEGFNKFSYTPSTDRCVDCILQNKMGSGCQYTSILPVPVDENNNCLKFYSIIQDKESLCR